MSGVSAVINCQVIGKVPFAVSSCEDPKYMAAHPDQAMDKMRQLLEKLMNLKQRSADDCDTILRQYKTFIREVGRHAREFSAFNNIEDELDTFLFTHLGKKPRFEELWSLVKLLLMLLHGQSQVERGFSINKDITSTNMGAETLIAFCRVHDGIQSLGLPVEQCVTAEMLRQCKFACSCYQFHLEEMKRESKEQTEKKKKKKLDSNVTDLEREADQIALDAEKQNKMSMLVKSNALRSKAKEKRVKLEAEKQKIKDLKSKL